MIVFTILGLLVFWWVCGCIGYTLAETHDARQRIRLLTTPVHNELDRVIGVMHVYMTYGVQELKTTGERQ